MAEETVLHTLRDCKESKEAWLHLIPHELRGVFSTRSPLLASIFGRTVMTWPLISRRIPPNLFCKKAIYIGLKLAGDNGFEYVQVQSDCLDVVKLFQDHSMVCSCISLERDIDVYRRKCLVMEVIWILRDGNKPADNLAKHITFLHSVVLILEHPTDYLQPLLAEDTFSSPS
ncbi:hypothetical protein V6N11_044364 [Hibiscus sabdariffa]|uniref:RNase H type-1 domain-containing protein n=1 Tax=Hibiscus sabdariffa TaxID=183260 RepID=A0ABR2REZ1_9ROSI